MYLTYFLTFYPAHILTFDVAFVDTYSHILSGILLSGLCWGPGVPTASGAGDARIWRSGPGISGAGDMAGSSGSRRAP
jgi:hypothetical protein